MKPQQDSNPIPETVSFDALRLKVDSVLASWGEERNISEDAWPLWDTGQRTIRGLVERYAPLDNRASVDRKHFIRITAIDVAVRSGLSEDANNTPADAMRALLPLTVDDWDHLDD